MQAGDDDMVVQIGEKFVKIDDKLVKICEERILQINQREDTDIIFHYDDEDGGGDNDMAVWLFRETSYDYVIVLSLCHIIMFRHRHVIISHPHVMSPCLYSGAIQGL